MDDLAKKASLFIYLGIVMVFKRIFGKAISSDSEDESYVDLDSIIDEPRSSAGKIRVRIEKLNEYRDTERVQKYVREGDIVLVETMELKNKDIGELKRSIERIKKTVIAINGDIVMGPQAVLIVCPPSVMVTRIKE